MIGVLIIPTGIGASIGGHAGDANPVAKLIGVSCDKLILHPNVVNGSDLNEMPENALYVEGSILDRFLQGKTMLREVNQNRILVVANAPVTADTVNAVNAARVTVGIDAEIVELETPLNMRAYFETNGAAVGAITGAHALLRQVAGHTFDALAIHTPITVDRNVALHYFQHGGVNPWGGVEAKASKMIAEGLGKQVAHAPLETVTENDPELFYVGNEVVNPRIAPEIISRCYLHCVLKGLNRAPRPELPPAHRSLSVDDVDFLLSPHGCWGSPHRACAARNIPIFMVEENRTILDLPISGSYHKVQNYLEAAGRIMAMRAGVLYNSVCAGAVT